MSSSISNGYKTNHEFRVGIVGFSQVEKSLIGGVCKLSQTRVVNGKGPSNRFFLIDLLAERDAEIYLIDAKSADQERFVQQARFSETPFLLVSEEQQQTTRSNEYTLTHKQLIGLLLRNLDRIVDERFKAQINSPGKTSSHAKKCMVVDDSKLVRAQMELILNQYALDIEFAEDAETALQRVKDKQFDLIFLDVMLPEMDGYKACKLLKADPVSSATPVVMLTSKRSPFNRMHGALVGCDRYLTKPVDADKVRETLERYNLIDTSTAARSPQPLSA